MTKIWFNNRSCLYLKNNLIILISLANVVKDKEFNIKILLNDCNINYRWNVDEVGYKLTLYNTWVLILSKISTNYSYKGFRINKNYDTVTTDVHSTMSRQINILFQFIKIIWTSTYLIYKCNMQDTIAGLEINTRQKSYTLCSLWHMYYYF